MDFNLTHTERTVLSVKQLRWTLVDLKDSDSSLTVKFNLAGQGWQSSFYKIVHISDFNIVLVDERKNQLKFVALQDILQFSTNRVVRNKTVHDHYQVH